MRSVNGAAAGAPPESERSASGSLFRRSLNPMLLVDDERRCADANAAACLFLRLPREEICKLRIDDLLLPDRRVAMDASCTEFLERHDPREGTLTEPWDLQLPDGTRIAVDLAFKPQFRPGRHLAVILFPPARALNDRVSQTRPANSAALLTRREREILTLVARGNTGVQIAEALFLSPATVQTHVVNTLTKLRAKNRAHGIAIALQTGELDLDDRLREPPRSPELRAPKYLRSRAAGNDAAAAQPGG